MGRQLSHSPVECLLPGQEVGAGEGPRHPERLQLWSRCLMDLVLKRQHLKKTKMEA